MNFLLHHHLAADALGSDVAGFGAMLPDLWRMADRRVRAADGIASDGEGALGQLLAGIAHHLAADRLFHADEPFLEGERAAAEVLGRARAPRARLFAHVAWELCLDGALLRGRGFGSILAAVRRGAEAGNAATDDASVRHHFGRVVRTQEERLAFQTRAANVTRELLRGPWIEGYQHGAGIALRLSGVRARLGLSAFDEEDAAALGEGLDALIPLADRALAALLGDRRYRPNAR